MAIRKRGTTITSLSGGKRRKKNRRAKRGGALTDYLPTSYIPESVKDYASSAYNTYYGITPEPTVPVIVNKPVEEIKPSGDIFSKVRKIKPVSYIDNALQELGVRDSVRKKLGKSKFGRKLVKTADQARQLGFGGQSGLKGQGRKNLRRKMYGGCVRSV